MWTASIIFIIFTVVALILVDIVDPVLDEWQREQAEKDRKRDEAFLKVITSRYDYEEDDEF